MEAPLHVVCTTCGHDGPVGRRPPPGRHWRCTHCAADGVEASEVDCVGCGMLIPLARRQAIPQTNHCVACAAGLAYRPAIFAEPLGSRDDFKRDRAAWRR